MPPPPDFLCGVVEGFYGRPWTMDQRRTLFERMQRMGMGMYMYAPKDDLKHRAEWRRPYDLEESACLRQLIRAAVEHNVTFVYALSPGIDIRYSSTEEVNTLLDKFKQVRELGCRAFAILFDDIEIRMNAADNARFGSFAAAQVHVANAIYSSLAINCRAMLFCPTEYCESRAMPSLEGSEYLNYIGKHLHADMSIMWTGPRVISRIIDEEHCRRVERVLRRPPLIWDNIHANDYDPRRLFLGPYAGRPVSARQHMRGVLTNPNCEFEANYVAMHTLARWVTCTKDVPYIERDLSIAVLQPPDEPIDRATYSPAHALQLAINDWIDVIRQMYVKQTSTTNSTASSAANAVVQRALSESSAATSIALTFSTSSTTTSGTCTPIAASVIGTSRQSVSTESGSGRTSTGQSVATEDEGSGVTSTGQSLASVDDTYVDLLTPVAQTGALPVGTPLEMAASILDPNVPPPLVGQATLEAASTNADGATFNSLTAQYTAVCSEPMESTPSSGEHSLTLQHAPMTIGGQLPVEVRGIHEVTPEENTVMPTAVNALDISIDDLAVIADLFYLPFEHGAVGRYLAEEYEWLRGHAHIAQPSSWYSRATMFNTQCARVLLAYNRVLYSSALPVILDMYAYLYEIHQIVVLLRASVAWLAEANLMADGEAKSVGPPEADPTAEDEPWVRRGGLIAELHAVFVHDSVHIDDLFVPRPLPPPMHSVYSIRPLLHDDTDAIYKLCTDTFDDGYTAEERFGSHPKLIGDRMIGALLNHSTSHCFVLEEQFRRDAIDHLNDVVNRDNVNGTSTPRRIVGFACCALDARALLDITHTLHAARMVDEYNALSGRVSQNEDESMDTSEQVIAPEDIVRTFLPNHPSSRWTSGLPTKIGSKHPSMCIVRVEAHATSAAVKMLLAMACTSVAASGSPGIYAVHSAADTNLISQLTAHGFTDIGTAVDLERKAACLCENAAQSELAVERHVVPDIVVESRQGGHEEELVYLARRV